MTHLPPKPNFIYEMFYSGHQVPKEFAITKSTFNSWYNKEIVPLFENAIEVYSWANSTYWRPYKDCDKPTKSALLIGITPIKEESAEDLLKEVCKFHSDFETMMNAIHKARKYLESRK